MSWKKTFTGSNESSVCPQVCVEKETPITLLYNQRAVILFIFRRTIQAVLIQY